MIKDYNKRSRNFMIELYPDNETHIGALSKLLNGEIHKHYDGLRYIGICHDKDTFDDTTSEHIEGELKKTHYHFVVTMNNTTKRSALANKLGIEQTMIEPCDKLKGALCYLIHLNTDKYQYDVSDLFGDADYKSLINDVKSKDNSAYAINSMFNYIKNYQGFLTFADFMNACYTNGWTKFSKQYQLIIKESIVQHNQIFNGNCVN